MDKIIQEIKQNNPPELRSINQRMRILLNGIIDLQFWDSRQHFLPGIGWYLHPYAINSRKKLSKLFNIHKGERCIIIGNGPSLSHMDMGLIQDEITFGLNRIYLAFPKFNFSTTYYVSVNRLVIEQSSNEISQLPMTKFISWHAREYLDFKKEVVFIRDAYDGTMEFAEKPTWNSWENGRVSNFCSYAARLFHGFSKVILIGVDHNFITKGEPHKVIESDGPDLNHFDSTYFGKGFRWNLPDLKTSELAYKLAKHAFEADGREIVDATVDGKLNIFQKVDFLSLF